MTPFSTVLKSFMKEKNMKAYALAQYCEIDCSNMYKIMNGNAIRLPRRTLTVWQNI